MKNVGKKKNKLLICLLSVCSLGLGSCTATAPTSNEDVLTLKNTSEDRTQITVLVKYAFSIQNFEEIVEEQFPDIDIVQVGNYTANTTLAKEYETRLEHDDLTDIVMTWPYDVGEEYWSERLIDLSGMPFSSKYNASMLDTIATENGSLYYLPGPAEIRGIIYNKTMFEENGWVVPTNYDEFIELCKEIEASGNRAFQLPLGNSEVLDTAFVGFNYGTAYSKPTDTKWLADYNNGTGNFIDHFSEALVTFQDLIDEGILKKEDLSLYYADTQSNLFNRKTVMTEDSVLLARKGSTMGNKDEFALMPFFSRTPQNDWSRIYMTCYIGLNKHLQDDDQKDKYDKVMKLMDYISTPEGQKALASDNGAMYSSLRNMEAPEVDEIQDLRRSLSQGRYGIFPTLKQGENALREGLKDMILGTKTAQQLADKVDQENKLASVEETTTVIGNATEDFTYIETGNLICDILKEKAQSDIALFLDNGKDGNYNGKGVSAKFYQGDLTQEDITRVFPDLKHDEQGELVIVEMTGENIVKALEYSLTVDNQSDWFYYFSGLKLTFHPLNKQGSRISDISLSDGQKLENDKIYKVAIMDQSVANEYINSSQSTGIYIKDLLLSTIKEKGTISPSNDNRFSVSSK